MTSNLKNVIKCIFYPPIFARLYNIIYFELCDICSNIWMPSNNHYPCKNGTDPHHPSHFSVSKMFSKPYRQHSTLNTHSTHYHISEAIVLIAFAYWILGMLCVLSLTLLALQNELLHLHLASNIVVWNVYYTTWPMSVSLGAVCSSLCVLNDRRSGDDKRGGAA